MSKQDTGEKSGALLNSSVKSRDRFQMSSTLTMIFSLSSLKQLILDKNCFLDISCAKQYGANWMDINKKVKDYSNILYQGSVSCTILAVW